MADAREAGHLRPLLWLVQRVFAVYLWVCWAFLLPWRMMGVIRARIHHERGPLRCPEHLCVCIHSDETSLAHIGRLGEWAYGLGATHITIHDTQSGWTASRAQDLEARLHRSTGVEVAVLAPEDCAFIHGNTDDASPAPSENLAWLARRPQGRKQQGSNGTKRPKLLVRLVQADSFRQDVAFAARTLCARVSAGELGPEDISLAQLAAALPCCSPRPPEAQLMLIFPSVCDRDPAVVLNPCVHPLEMVTTELVQVGCGLSAFTYGQFLAVLHALDRVEQRYGT